MPPHHSPRQGGWLLAQLTGSALSSFQDTSADKALRVNDDGDVDTGALAISELNMALARRTPAAGLLHHSDSGGQYCAAGYRTMLDNHCVTASMSRKGDCWDNAPAECFFGTLKTELINHERYEKPERKRWRTYSITSRCSIIANVGTDFAEHMVAFLVAIFVVVLLEVIDFEEYHGEAAFVSGLPEPGGV